MPFVGHNRFFVNKLKKKKKISGIDMYIGPHGRSLSSAAFIDKYFLPLLVIL